MNNLIIEPAVLVVEDDLDTSKMLSYLLKMIGFKRVLVSSNGIDAMQLVSSTKGIICILSDWNMPKMSGLEFFKEIKKIETLRKVPFLMLTTVAYKDKVNLALSEGVHDYIIKPYNTSVIEEKLKRALGSKYPN